MDSGERETRRPEGEAGDFELLFTQTEPDPSKSSTGTVLAGCITQDQYDSRSKVDKEWGDA